MDFSGVLIGILGNGAYETIKLLGKNVLGIDEDEDKVFERLYKSIELASQKFFEKYPYEFGRPESSFLARQTNIEAIIRSIFYGYQGNLCNEIDPNGFERAPDALPEAIDFFLRTLEVTMREDYYLDRILTDKHHMQDTLEIKHQFNQFINFHHSINTIDQNIDREMKQVIDACTTSNNLRDTLFDKSKEFFATVNRPRGRFYHLNISDTILSDASGCIIDVNVLVNERKQFSLKESLESLWRRECWHAFIIGEGGMGKTVSLLKLWEMYLDVYNDGMPIPIFLVLNEYNDVDEDWKRNFIFKSIGMYYLGKKNLSKEEENQLWNLMIKPITDGDRSEKPSIILLLDGLNEISSDKSGLLIEINRLVNNCSRGVQIIFTSRVDMRSNLNLNEFNKLNLLGLNTEQINTYIKFFSTVSMPNGKLLNVVQNPMMLTIYASMCQMVENNKRNDLYEFKEKVQAPGELLWNFIESLVVKHHENIEKSFYYKFILKHFLPHLGWQMEQEGKFSFSGKELRAAVNNAYEKFNCSEFFDAFPFFMEYEEKLYLGRLPESDERKRFTVFKKTIVDELAILVEEKDTYRFLHQNFRDYFTAVHIINEIQTSLSENGPLPNIMKASSISYYVGKYMGEIEGEHYNVPILDIRNRTWSAKHYKETRLGELLKRCRKISVQNTGYVVWNIIEIWKNVRGELTGSDFSVQDLSNIVLNMVKCSRGYGDNLLAVLFDYSLLNERNILPQGHSNDVKSAVYSSDDKRILSASRDKTIKEWDAVTGECLRTYEGHSSSVTSAVYSSDSKRILSASADTIKEWDAVTGECLRTYQGHSSKITSAVYSSDDKRILSASRDKTIKEWDVVIGECLRTYLGHSSSVNRAAYSNDGERILSASWDKTIKEWNAMTGECVRTYKGHSDYVNSAVYSNDGKRILSASMDKAIKQWNAVTGECIRTYQANPRWVGEIISAVFSNDGKRILFSGDDIVEEWDEVTGERLHTYQVYPSSTAVYSNDGKRVLIASCDTIKEWDVVTEECIRTYQGNSSSVTSAVYSSNGKQILSASTDKTIKEWDAVTGECLHIYQGHSDGVTSAVYSNDGKQILSASDDETVKEWDAMTGECLHTYQGHSGGVTSAVYSCDGKRILSASNDATIKEWNTVTGECLSTYEGHSSSVTSAIYGNDDSKRILSSSTDTIKVWDSVTGERLRTYQGHSSSLASAVYSSDSKRILSSSRDTIKEWDVVTGECLRTYQGHSDDVTSVVYSSDGKRILSASGDKTIKEWDAVTGECLCTYQEHSNQVTSAVYSSDGKRILSASGDETIKEWDVLTGECIKTIENIPGLIIQGCSFRDLQATSGISDRCKEILKMYRVKEICINDKYFPGNIERNNIKEDKCMSKMRFAVALSFPGEYRDYLRKVDNELSKLPIQGEVFFDERYEAEIAGFGADTILQKIYHDQSETIVVFLCKEYEQKEWCCNIEWRAIRDLIKKRSGNRVLPLRFDNSEIPGIYSIDICPDISKRSPKDTAKLIFERLKIVRENIN